MNRGGVANQVLGGWLVSGVISWQSGAPVGIYAQRGTFNRAIGHPCAGRARRRPCPTLSVDEIKKCRSACSSRRPASSTGFDPKVLNSDGRAVGTDTAGNTATYAGQIFFNPMAGQVGDLPILAFDAPDVFVVERRIDEAVHDRGALVCCNSASRRQICSTRCRSASATRTSTARRSVVFHNWRSRRASCS